MSRCPIQKKFGKELRHDFVDPSIMESVVGNRFDKVGSETVRVVREQDALFRRIVIGEQLTGLRFLDQLDSFAASTIALPCL
jgi:hypothetical protein